MLVSVIIPTTTGRAKLLETAIRSYDSQDWPDKELIIIEGTDSIGVKLNSACQQAKGDILVRFDDDDWSAPNRISNQVNVLVNSKRNLTGYNSIYFWDYLTKTASIYKGLSNYCLGTSMCFTRHYWETNKFEDSSYGEDLNFQKKAKNSNDVISVPADQMMVATIHGNNTGSNKCKFPTVEKSKLPKEFFEMIGG